MAEKQMDFEYFNPYDSEQFQFIRIPKILLTDASFKGLSFAAKGLYGLFLDRVGLSKENNWVDGNGRVYVIYTVEQVADVMGCGRDTAMKLLAELDTKNGIGLIERQRQGRGKPDLIYVKNFFVKQEVEKTDPEEADIPAAEEVEKTDFRKSEKSTSGGRKNRLQEVENIDPNKNNISNTESSKTDLILPSAGARARAEPQMDGKDEIRYYTDRVRENVGYDYITQDMPQGDIALVDEIVEEAVELLCSRQEEIKIGRGIYTHEFVMQRILRLNPFHVQYILSSLRDISQQEKIRNIKAYRQAAIFNAPVTMETYYSTRVAYDFCAGQE